MGWNPRPGALMAEWRRTGKVGKGEAGKGEVGGALPGAAGMTPWAGRPGRGAMEARVKAGIWVSMALRLSDIAGRSGAVLRKRDPDSGGILCVLRGREGLMVLSQVRDAEGRPAWLRGSGAMPVD